jgi:hypothetical protein
MRFPEWPIPTPPVIRELAKFRAAEIAVMWAREAGDEIRIEDWQDWIKRTHNTHNLAKEAVRQVKSDIREYQIHIQRGPRPRLNQNTAYLAERILKDLHRWYEVHGEGSKPPPLSP